MKPSIYITRKIPERALAYLQERCTVKMWEKEDEPVPRNVLEREIAYVDGLYCMLTESVDRKLLDLAGRLKAISNMAVGYNNIDVDDATKKGIAVTNTPGVLTETTADLTFALLMAAARRVPEAEQYLKDGKWRTWSPMLLTGQDIYGATLGIIGLGRIGAAVARRAKGFNMKLVYQNRSAKPELEQELGIERLELSELLKISDFVCVLVPYTPETKNLINKKQFALMKNTAVLVNTSRGGVVDEDDLYQALISNRIWAAGLDVFEREPVPVDHPLLSLSQVVALPHIGSASINTRKKMALLAAENMTRVLTGKAGANIINPSYADQVKE